MIQPANAFAAHALAGAYTRKGDLWLRNIDWWGQVTATHCLDAATAAYAAAAAAEAYAHALAGDIRWTPKLAPTLIRADADFADAFQSAITARQAAIAAVRDAGDC